MVIPNPITLTMKMKHPVSSRSLSESWLCRCELTHTTFFNGCALRVKQRTLKFLFHSLVLVIKTNVRLAIVSADKGTYYQV